LSDRLEVVVFTDGAAKGNPGPGGWGAVICVDRAAVRELGASGGHTTNNRMEMTAALQALSWLRGSGASQPLAVSILTDSTYLIRGVTEWMASWKRRGWKTAEGQDVANRDLWENLAEAIAELKAVGSTVKWRYVRGHTGIAGNERADVIATTFASAIAPKLYEGPFESYGIEVDPDVAARVSQPARKGTRAAAAAPKKTVTYLSVVDGIPARHATWAECERRVKGRSNARFKKAASVADEEAILAEWGFTPADLSAR